MLNLKPNDIDPKTNEGDLTKLVPDCYSAKCNNNNLYLEIDTIKNKNEVTTNHYYLIEALKNDNMRIIEKYYENSRNNVNDVLLYGYPGNTILHEALYYNAQKSVDYLLSKNINLSLVNKDGNALHVGCLKGSYDTVNKMIKSETSVNCDNNIGDTALQGSKIWFI